MPHNPHFIFSPRADLHTLLTENKLWEDVYEDLYLRFKVQTDKYKIDALTMLNEVYLQCVRVVAEMHPEDCFKERFFNHPLRKDSVIKRRYERNMCLSLVYVVLSLSNARTMRHVKTFLQLLEREMKTEPYYFSEAALYVVTCTKQYDCDIVPEEVEALTESLETRCARLEDEVLRLKQEKEAVLRDFVEAIIRVGEQYPSNQNDKAEVIRSLLLEKAVNGYIPGEVLTEEMRERINAIGRKEVANEIHFSGNVGTVVAHADQVNVNKNKS